MSLWRETTVYERVAILLIGAMVATTTPMPAFSQESRPAGATTRPSITLGYDTTRITKPLCPDGTPDYLAAINERYSKGVTPENNAAVIMFEVVDPNYWFTKGWRTAVLSQWGYKPKGTTAHLHVIDDDSPIKKEFDEAIENPWRSKEHPALSEWLKQNEQPLRLFVEASKRPRFYVPLVAPGVERGGLQMISASMPPLSVYRHAAKVLAVRANLAISEGRFQDAWQDILAVHRLGGLLGQGATLIERIVGMGISFIADRSTAVLASSEGLPAKLAKHMINDIQTLAPTAEIVSVVDLEERFCYLDSVIHCRWEARPGGGSALSRIPAKVLFDSNKELVIPANTTDRPESVEEAMRRGNAYYDAMVKGMTLPTFSERVKTLATVAREPNQAKIEARDLSLMQSKDPNVRSRWFGSMWMALLAHGFTKPHVMATKAETNRQLSLLAVAMAAYKAEKAQFPAKLDDLTPEYLKEIPKDLFTEKPLVYKRHGKGYILYSLGPNMKDDGGKSMDDDRENYDIVVKVQKAIAVGDTGSRWRSIDEAVSAAVNKAFDKTVREFGGRVVATEITYPSQAKSRPVTTTQSSAVGHECVPHPSD